MTNYVNPEELYARYPGFEENSTTNVNSDILYYAAREVEARLAKNFSVPFSENYPVVKDLVITAAWVRYQRDIDVKEGERLAKLLDERFKRILKGEEEIVSATGEVLGRTSRDADTPWSTTENWHPVHSMLGAENEYTHVSSDRLGYLEDIRE